MRLHQGQTSGIDILHEAKVNAMWLQPLRKNWKENLVSESFAERSDYISVYLWLRALCEQSPVSLAPLS